MKERLKDLLTIAVFVAASIFAAGGLATFDAREAQEAAQRPPEPSVEEIIAPTAIVVPAVSHAPGGPSTTVQPEPLFTEEDVEALAKVIWAEARGVKSDAEKAAVGWCALNRLDAGTYGETFLEVLTAPHQFASRESSPVTEELEALSRDVLERWQAERRGETGVGRTLPADYFFFEGDGERNHFRKQYARTGETWDWSLPNPYNT